MNLEPAQKELSKLSLRKIMGKSVEEGDFTERLSDLALKTWTSFLDEEVNDLLNDKQLQELGILLMYEDTTQEQLAEFFKKAIPDYEEIYHKKILKNKAIAVEGRIQYLRNMLSGKTELLSLLDDCDDLIKNGEWLRVEELLSTKFSEY